MIIIAYSETNSATIKDNFGNSEYSYFFVLKEFLPLLREIGTVFVVTDPAREVDDIYRGAAQRGEPCVFLSFSPPHRTPLGLACPTVPVFAWEYDTIPNETWFGERFQDWRYALNKFGRAITHSNFAVDAVQAAMGRDFPIAAIPAPIWNKFSALRQTIDESPIVHGVELNVGVPAIDSRTVDWSRYAPHRQPASDLAPLSRVNDAPKGGLQIDGVVYTSIFSSYDGRKNSFDMVDGFCSALRDAEDATLILKIGHKDSSVAIEELMHRLYQLTPFKCRVVLIDGYLESLDYERLLRSTTYAVNTSIGEGQCLPLMEYMSYGKPAVAPRHTGMMEYISADNTFVVDSTVAPGVWPHDPRGAYRTLTRRIDFDSLSKAFRESYRVAKEAPDRYRDMVKHARQALERHCSSAVTAERLRAFLSTAPRMERTDLDYGKVATRNLSYSLGKAISFVTEFDARRHLYSGWSQLELGNGVWSDGPAAELAFRIEPKPEAVLVFRVNLNGFVNPQHPKMSIGVSANGLAVDRWEFDIAHPAGTRPAWRSVTIPAEIASSDEIRIAFQIEHPASPAQLGLSTDSRLLGVMLRALSIAYETAPMSKREAAVLASPYASIAAPVDEISRPPSTAQATRLGLEAANRKYSQLEARFDELRRTAAAREADLAAARQTVSALQESNSNLRLQLTALEERKNVQLRYASWQVEQREKTIAEIRASNSYRLGRMILAPISWLKRTAFPLLVTGIKSVAPLMVAIASKPRNALQYMTAQRILRAGAMLLRNPRQFFEFCRIYATRLRTGPGPSNQAALAEKPAASAPRNLLVSLLIVNYNGKNHLEALFDSLVNLTYKHRETIMVDNGSTDGSVEFVKSRFPWVRTVELKNNVGFSEANNIGFEAASGDYICLLNNDTRCDPEFLTRLVDVLDSDPKMAAAGPKIRFWSQFSTIDIDLPGSATALLDVGKLFNGDRQSEYQKVFFQSGFSEPFMVKEKLVRRISSKAVLLLPAQRVVDGVDLHVFAETAGGTATVRVGGKQFAQALNANSWQALRLDAGSSSVSPEWIVNNAGSHVTDAGDIYDRGFGSPDRGHFDAADEPTALCGCAMLVRRAALKDDEPLFAKEFFAYFEDTDLSLRLRRNGYRLAYCPSSVVYHKHASTSSENSPMFRYYVNRNRVLFYALHFPETFWREKLVTARAELTGLKRRYQSNASAEDEQAFGGKIDGIVADWDRLLPLIAAGRFYDRKRHFPRLAVYNNYWNSMGGGEYHAAVIAEALQTLGPVELICERDFSIEDVAQRFDIDLSRCRKVVVSAADLHHHASATERYDMLVNSTYASDLISRAKLSVYVVSFPYRTDERPAGADRFLASYDLFLANSNYTKEWCRRYWHVEAETLYPSTASKPPVPDGTAKAKIILNVGRFFWHGHNKKQLELVEIFKQMATERSLGPGWKLVLAGQVESGQEDYYNAVSAAAQGLPIELRPNISKEELTKLYQAAAIYWHATGVGEDLDKFPERAEHFGITTLEAMRFGCVPVVIGAGGQPEIVVDGVSGYLFTDAADLKEKTARLAKTFDLDPNRAFTALSSHARARAAEFSKERTQARFLALLAAAKSSKGATVELELS